MKLHKCVPWRGCGGKIGCGILRISASDNKDLDFLYEAEAFNLIDESFINDLDG